MKVKEGGDALCASKAHPIKDKLQLRGAGVVQDELLLAAIAQNLQRMAKC